MCGIAGFCDFNKQIKKHTLISMTDMLSHRGPDDSGYLYLTNNDSVIGLGHRRLSIIDLSPSGHQPMSCENENYFIVYNGETYNFTEIRKELISLGYTFVSNSDTEVVLKAYICWGNEAVKRMIGMFAFVIYDKILNQFFICTDRVGVKPLYIFWNNHTFMFSSELKSFHSNSFFQPRINYNSLALYLRHGYIPSPHAIYENCYKLSPGHFLILNINKQTVEENIYWNVIDYYNEPKDYISEPEAMIEIEKILLSSFNYRMVSDVPVGVFLSGGYDSTAVAAILQSHRTEKIKTYTIGFHEHEYNEATFASKVASCIGTDHTEYYCTQKEALNIIPNLPEIYDEPFGDSSVIPTVLVSKLARSKVKVSLSADGGDEIFAGYSKYKTALVYYNYFSKLPMLVRKSIASFMKIINPDMIPFFRKRYNFATRYEKVRNIVNTSHIVNSMDIVSRIFMDNEIERIIDHHFTFPATFFSDYGIIGKENDLINSMLAIDYKTYLPGDIMTKVDRATMSVSLEGREPLLDHRIIELICRLPSNYKFSNDQSKRILKKIVHKYVPERLMNRPKKGFGIPIEYWFRDHLKPYFMTYLNKERLNRQGIFKGSSIEKIRDRYLEGQQQNVQKLWVLLMFQLWCEKWGHQ